MVVQSAASSTSTNYECLVMNTICTFPTVILNQERIAHGFLHAVLDRTGPRHPRAEPELPAPYPARVIRERDVPDAGDALREHDEHLARQQRPLALPLEHDALAELLLAVLQPLVGVEVAVEDEELQLHGGQGPGGDRLVGGGVGQGDAERLLVLGLHPVAREKGLGQVSLELQLVPFGACLELEWQPEPLQNRSRVSRDTRRVLQS
jgi:hypothetical protein